MASGLPQQGSDAHNKLSFSLPTVMSPAHFMVGAVPYGLATASEMSRSPVPSPSTPEHSRLYGSAAGTPHSPVGPRQTVSISTPEPLVRTACNIVAPSTHTQTHRSLNFNIFSFIVTHDLSAIGQNATTPLDTRASAASVLWCVCFPSFYSSRRCVCVCAAAVQLD